MSPVSLFFCFVGTFSVGLAFLIFFGILVFDFLFLIFLLFFLFRAGHEKKKRGLDRDGIENMMEILCVLSIRLWALLMFHPINNL